jgi:protein-S-isoprenylcysteine O-methyltransferase Ste14
MTDRDKGPAVPFPPPLVYVAALGAGALLERYVPLVSLALPPWLDIVGLVLVLAGLAVVFTGILTFRRFRTAVYPNRPAKVLVDTGVYAYTRNPMYSGMTLLYVGMSLVMGSVWCLLLLPVVLFVMVTQVIGREERYLRQRFPKEYAEYCRRVGRWV